MSEAAGGHVYLESDGVHDGHRIQTVVIPTRHELDADRDTGAPPTTSEVGVVTLVNFQYIVDGDSRALYDPAAVERQFPTAYDAGVQYISMRARPGSLDWERLPRFGFDAPLAACVGPELPPGGQYGPTTTVRDLLDTEAGRVWWHKLGMREPDFSPIFYFNTDESSEAVRALLDFLESDASGPLVVPEDLWHLPLLRPRISELQRQAEAVRLAAWNAHWHGYLEELYAIAEVDYWAGRIQQIQTIVDEPDEDDEDDGDAE